MKRPKSEKRLQAEKKAREAAIACARASYCSDDIEIDDNPDLSIADNGVWVQAWVWVSNNETRKQKQ